MRGRRLGAQPPNGDQMLDSMEFRVARQDRSSDATGRGDTERIRVRDRIGTFDFRRLADQRQIDRNQFNGQLFQKPQGFRGPFRAHFAFDDVKEFAPIDPVQVGFGSSPLLLVQNGTDLFPPGFLMEEAYQRKTIEDEFFAHAGPPPDARDGGRPSGRTCP